MAVDVVLGCQAGDEGKGLVVDRIIHNKKHKIVARFNGGANAGHTLYYDGREINVHQIPSGIVHRDILNVIGNGSLFDPVRLVEDEMPHLRQFGIHIGPDNLAISDTAHMVMPHHLVLDELRELGKHSQGSTKRGISFVAADKYERTGARVELITWAPDMLRQIALTGLELANIALKEAGLPTKNPEAEFAKWMDYALTLQPFFQDTVTLLNARLEAEPDLNILAEGAQSIGLDIEHGIYPLGTSSHTTPGGVLNGLGINHHHLGRIIGVAKIIKSRVGGDDSSFVTKITDEKLAAKLRGSRKDVDGEYGKSTGRERQLGYFDISELRRAKRVAGITELVITKLDIVPRFGTSMKVAVGYDFHGKRIDMTPNSALKLRNTKPIYKTLPVWDGKLDISHARHLEDLPPEARKFVSFIEKELDLPVSMIGVGPDRDQAIVRPV